MDTPIVAHGDEGRVNEADAGATPKQAEQVGAQARENTGHELDEAGVRDQSRKLST
jgi:hypothetical protein